MSEYKTTNWHPSDLHLENQSLKAHFLSKYDGNMHEGVYVKKREYERNN